MKIFYFTATGNNLYLAKSLGGDLYSIPKALKEGNLEYADDCIGIIFPCYYFATPAIVREFIEKASLKSDYIFAILSYGSFSFAANDHLLKIAKKAGIKISYFNKICMVDNYIPLFEIQKQKKIKSNEIIEEKLSRIKDDIKSRKENIKRNNLLNNLVTFLAQFYFKIRLKNVDKQFRVEDSCNRCKVCERVCPVDNIQLEEKPQYLHHCIECLACTHACPQNAIRVKREKSRERYINQHVSLEEIIEANQ